MSVPNCVVGNQHAVESERGTVTIVIPMESELGSFFMEINYKDTEGR